MSDFILATWAAFTFGFLTSISPCLLATNVTAISFIARRLDRPRMMLLSGAFYTFGQALGFVLLAAAVVGSLVAIEPVSHWLQKYMFRILGPILILVGLALLEMLVINPGSGRLKAWAQQWGKGGGYWATLLLGLLFAMSFCPTTAALFFGGLIPLALSHESSVLLPLAYAVGVSVPVVGIVLLIVFAAGLLGRALRRVSITERWMRRIAGLVFLGVGVYFTLAYSLALW